MPVQLDSYLQGSWTHGEGSPRELVDPTSEQTLATISSHTSTLAPAVAWAREQGGANLRRLSFGERGALLKAIAAVVHEHREELIEIAIQNGGNTRKDAKFDIDGGTAVLAHYAYLAKGLGEQPWLVADEAAEVYRGSKIRAQHVLVPRRGLAVHINAFNFPAWGMLGKAAVSLLAGMPVLCKPATSTAWLAHRITQLIVAADILPAGALNLLMGSAGDLLDCLGPQDVIAFTGSQGVGQTVATQANVVAKGVRVNLEADSLNAVVLGPDVEPGSELFDLAIRDLVIEMTQKAGQKCTATRRVLVPEARLADVKAALFEGLGEVAGKTGDPSDKSTRMGPLTSASQLADARDGIAELRADAELVHGDPERSAGWHGSEGGFFLEPIVLEARADRVAAADASFHRIEVFGPVATLLPYDGSIEQAAKLIGLGSGRLDSTVYSDDRGWTARAVSELGPYLGRLVVASEKVAPASQSPGCVFAVANHGGPGRAGGGEELGGVYGLGLYMQRLAVQGGAGPLARMLKGG